MTDLKNSVLEISTSAADIKLSKSLSEAIIIKKSSIDGYYGSIKTENGVIEIGSRYSQKRNAEKKIKEITFEPSTFYWLVGISSIEYVEGLLNKLPGSSILWIIEPYPEFYAKLSSNYDLKFLNQRNFNLVLHSDINTFIHLVQDWLIKEIPQYEQVRMIESDVYKEIPFIDVNKWVTMINSDLSEACLMAEMAISTMDVSVENYFSNFYDSIKNQDWLQVQKTNADKPMVIIGAGPSLFTEYEVLREIQDYVYIGVVDNALKTIVSEGISPDYVFQVDWQKDTLDFYRDIEISPKTILVTTPGAYAGVIEHWPGQLLFLQAPQLKPLSQDFILSSIPSFFGTNVGMLAVQFAAISHANPVCLVGYDMGAPMMTHFHPKVLGLNDIYPSTNRFWSVDKYNYEFLKKNKETITIKNQQGVDMWTAMSIEKGRKSLESFLFNNKTYERFIYCSKYGAGFNGMKYKALNEVFSTEEFSKKESIQLDKHCLNYDRFQINIEDKLKRVKNYFRIMEDIYHSGLDYLEIYEKDKEGQNTSHLVNEYQKNLDRLYKSGSAWIENLLVEMDRRLIILHHRDNLLLEDLKTNKEKMVAKIKQFVSHYPSVKKHKQWLISYILMLIKKNKEALKL
jgi:hypothetical protein